MMRALLIGGLLLCAGCDGFKIPGPFHLNNHAELNCGLYTSDYACQGNGDCSDRFAADWNCVDGFCRRECGEASLCSGEGYCRPAALGCNTGRGEIACGRRCIKVTQVSEFQQTCCGGCGLGQTCCGMYNENGFVADQGPHCVDLESDTGTTRHTRSCGDCATVCRGNQVCLAGGCVGDCLDDSDCQNRQDGKTLCCDHLCADPRLDEHCGSCDNQCQSPLQCLCHTPLCMDNACRSIFEQDCCSTSCIDCRGIGEYCNPAGECRICADLYSAAECGAGYTCVPDGLRAADHNRCVTQATSTLAHYQPCTYDSFNNPCSPAESCVEVAAANQRCSRLCASAGDCQPDGGSAEDGGTACIDASAGWHVCGP
jgi:hypothetical protein